MRSSVMLGCDLQVGSARMQSCSLLEEESDVVEVDSGRGVLPVRQGSVVRAL